MDLLSISRTVWRHKLATIPVLLIMLLGAAYVMVVKAPIYEAQSSYVLLPAPPLTPQALARDPALKHANPNNPFTSFGDLSVVADLLTEVMNGPAESQALGHQGLAGGYTVAPLNTTFGNAPIIQITTQGSSAASATNSAVLVGRAFQGQLANLQASQGTNKQFWIGSLELSSPNLPREQVSSKLRDLVAVIALGVVLLFVIVSTMNAREERTRERLSVRATVAEEDEARPVRAVPELNGLMVDASADDPERVHMSQPVRASLEPGARLVALEEELNHSSPRYFDSQGQTAGSWLLRILTADITDDRDSENGRRQDG